MKKHILNPVKSRLLIASLILVCGMIYGQTTCTVTIFGDLSNSSIGSSGLTTPSEITSNDQSANNLGIDIIVVSPYSTQEYAPNTGINEAVQGDGDIIIYPNPVSEELFVKNITGTSGLLNGEIYNALGQMLSSFQVTNVTASIPVYKLSRGSYFIKLYNDKIQVVKKFSKL